MSERAARTLFETPGTIRDTRRRVRSASPLEAAHWQSEVREDKQTNRHGSRIDRSRNEHTSQEP